VGQPIRESIASPCVGEPDVPLPEASLTMRLFPSQALQPATQGLLGL